MKTCLTFHNFQHGEFVYKKGGLDVIVKNRIRIDELDDFHSAHLKLMNKLFELILNYFILTDNEFVDFKRHFSRVIGHRIYLQKSTTQCDCYAFLQVTIY